jgi:DNA-directed RNA polymerase II subunit RPB2
LSRTTGPSTLSLLRRVNTPIGKDGKLLKPRQVHNSHFGLICPSETPEGSQCGLVKNLSLIAAVSIGTPKYPILRLLEQCGVTSIADINLVRTHDTRILVNSDLFGIADIVTTRHVVDTLKNARRYGQIALDVSIAWNIKDREVHIFTDVGRVYRPLRIAPTNSMPPNNQQHEDWSKFCSSHYQDTH